MRCFPLISSGIALFFGVLSLSFAQTDQTPWQLRQEDDGIQIYTRPLPDNPIDEVKAVTIVEGNIDSAFVLISDLQKFAKTDPYIKEVSVISVIDSTDAYIYQIANMPFFMQDRDAVGRMRCSRTNQGYFISFTGEDGIKELSPDYTRIKDFLVYVSLRRLTTNTFELMYKGSITGSGNETAAKFANKAIVKSTYERLSNIRKLVMPPTTAKK